MVTTRTCYTFNAAIVRQPSPSVVNGLRAVDRGNPDFKAVEREHRTYINALESAGLKVTLLPPLTGYPNSIFVEDPALVFSQGAILLNPGSDSRRGETAEITPTLDNLFERVLTLEQPGFTDGGDILVTPHSVMIGLSSRTDMAGAKGLKEQLEKLGLKGEIVEPPKGVLHLKTACSLLDEETILVTRPLLQSGIFDNYRTITVPEGEEPAANVLRLNDILLVSANYKRTANMLDNAGYLISTVDTTEIEKIDAGLSCMSLRWYTED